jgi:hypothetical protein
VQFLRLAKDENQVAVNETSSEKKYETLNDFSRGSGFRDFGRQRPQRNR